MGNRAVNYPDILPQEQSPTHLSLSCSSRVKTDVNVYNTTTRNDINSWKVIQASSAHLRNNVTIIVRFLIYEPGITSTAGYYVVGTEQWAGH